MRYTYDDEADALYVSLIEGADVAHSVVVDEGRSVDLGEDGSAVGIEVLGASAGVAVLDLVDRFDLGEHVTHLQTLEGQRFAPSRV